jgi:cell division protein ZipA
MNELRWILIGFGIVLLAVIYLWGRRGSAAVAEEAALRTRPEPSMQPHGFGDVRREPAALDEIPGYEPDAPTEDVAEASPDDYQVTAVRPASRAEPRSPRTEIPRAVSKDLPAVTSDIARPSTLPDFRRGRVEPTFDDGTTVELPAAATATAATATSAPTLSSSDTPGPRRSERRKILSVRLSVAPQRIEGTKLQEVLHLELLSHGKYDVFHRLHSDEQSIFSVASMVEPGTFDLEKMGETLYPGITLFAQLPGPVPGMHALNELVACARRMHQSLGGVLQDDRGVPLTVHRIERMRQEVRDFERPANPPGRAARGEGYQE